MRARSGPHEVQASLLGPTMRAQRAISNLPCVEDSLDTGEWDHLAWERLMAIDVARLMAAEASGRPGCQGSKDPDKFGFGKAPC